ncbi:hypothetical protein X772_34480 [Mesorhizobium sp. LSJC280B00]|nr:hypothetical protein X772_34480 [Mesorhizobium sp. LSJC280B00]
MIRGNFAEPASQFIDHVLSGSGSIDATVEKPTARFRQGHRCRKQFVQGVNQHATIS